LFTAADELRAVFARPCSESSEDGDGVELADFASVVNEECTEPPSDPDDPDDDEENVEEKKEDIKTDDEEKDDDITMKKKEEETDEEAKGAYVDSDDHCSEISEVSSHDRYRPKWSSYRPKPSSKSLARKVDPATVMALRGEESAARALKMRWQDRGPPVVVPGQKWRGQKYRPTGNGGKGRFGNAGGSNRKWYAGFYAAKGKGKDAIARYIAMYGPGPKLSDKGDGSSKGRSKGGRSSSSTGK